MKAILNPQFDQAVKNAVIDDERDCHETYSRHSVVIWERRFTALSPALRFWQAALNFSIIFNKNQKTEIKKLNGTAMSWNLWKQVETMV